LNQILKELQFKEAQPLTPICDNQVVLYIASNPVFHDMNKHNNIDSHIVKEKIESINIITSFIISDDELVDFLRNPCSIFRKSVDILINNKLL